MLDLHFYLCEKIIKFALWSMNMIVNRAGILTFQNYRIKSIINALILYELMPPVAMNLRAPTLRAAPIAAAPPDGHRA